MDVEDGQASHTDFVLDSLSACGICYPHKQMGWETLQNGDIGLEAVS